MSGSGVVNVHSDNLDRAGRVAVDRLRLLGAVLGDAGFAGVVELIDDYPVLYVTDPPAPWGVSVGATHFWLGDPAEPLCRSDRVLVAAWLIADRLRCRR
jgi:hypothetical protein